MVMRLLNDKIPCKNEWICNMQSTRPFPVFAGCVLDMSGSTLPSLLGGLDGHIAAISPTTFDCSIEKKSENLSHTCLQNQSSSWPGRIVELELSSSSPDLRKRAFMRLALDF